MGTTRPDIVEKLQGKHPGATVKDDLLPATLREGAATLRAPTGVEGMGFSSDASAAAGAEEGAEGRPEKVRRMSAFRSSKPNTY